MSMFRSNSRQRGVVLPLALVMLVMVTLTAVIAMRGVTSEERVSANLRSSSVAFEQAEIGLRHCRQIAIAGGATLNAARLESPSVPEAVAYKTPANWLTSAGKVQSPLAGVYQDTARPVTAPACLIESVRLPPSETEPSRRVEANAFVITARGFGDNSNGFRTTVQEQLRPPAF